jgi:hypothetical protein
MRLKIGALYLHVRRVNDRVVPVLAVCDWKYRSSCSVRVVLLPVLFVWFSPDRNDLTVRGSEYR